MSGYYAGGTAAAAAAAAAHQNHSLAFRVMRLCRPSFQAEDALLRLDLADLLAGEDLFDDPQLSSAFLPLDHTLAPAGASDFSFRNRFELQRPTDATGLSGILVLPQSFGAIYLGETFCSYISINNSSSFEARDVIIKAEIQTERQRVMLYDTTKSPVESIRSGGRYDFIVEHDVKELGPHTLVCTALYNDGDSERKYLPQYFKFVVANPLSVRTKVRTVKENTFLEACIENHTKSNLYMDTVDFEPAQNWAATRLSTEKHPSEINSTRRDIFRQPVLIRAGGGIYNYLYLLKPSLHDSGEVKADGSNILGKLQIIWRTNLGEPGRLQTQHILGNPIVQKEIEFRLVEMPSNVILERPFMVHLSLINQTDKTTGPLEVGLSTDPVEENTVTVIGVQKLVLQPLEAFSSTNFDLIMVATKLGVQRVTGITVFDRREEKTYGPLPEFEIFVDTE